jgi:CRISPR system Cascade subunit CasD
VAGLILRLAGPLQSWGEHSAFADRDTLRFPTRSGLIGLLASAQGRPRGASLRDYEPLRITVRIDRPGVLISDFHTIGGGRPRHQTVPTAEGKRRSVETATIVTRRHYLADAVFTAAIEGPDTTIEGLATALKQPHWPPYLGRRSCSPDQPLLLKAEASDPVGDLRTKVPVPAKLHPGKEPQLDFVVEGDRDDAETVTELADVPESFAPLDRRYRRRAVAIHPQSILRTLWIGSIRDYREALFSYMEAT